MYKNFYNPNHPGVITISKMIVERNKIVDKINKKELHESALLKENEKNDRISYVFCDGKFHFRSMGINYSHWVSSYRCPDFGTDPF